MTVFLYSAGNNTYQGNSEAYDQVDYDAPLSEFSIYTNTDGSVTVNHPTLGTDTLLNINGIWSDADQSWYSIEDAIAMTSNSPASATPDNAPTGPILYSLGDDTHTGSASEYSQVDYDGNLSDFSISRNDDGSVTVSHPIFGTDTLIHIDGLWIDGDQSWYSIDDAIALTSNVQAPGPTPTPTPTPTPDLNADGFTLNSYGVLRGTSSDDLLTDTDATHALYGGAGNDIFVGQADEYSQADYDGSASDYDFTLNSDGTVTVTNVEFGTDTLQNIDGIWFGGEEAWYSVEELLDGQTPVQPAPVNPTPVEPTPVEPTPNEPTPVEPTPVDPAPAGPNTGVLIDGIITGSNDVNDTLIGDAGNNVFFAGRGTDVIQGGAGTDTLNVDGDIFEWTFSSNADGSVTMTHPTWGENTLIGIEQITSQRSGQTFSIDDAIASTNGLPRFRLDNDNVINGTNGDDNIQGGADVQGFYGGTGNDVYFGTDGFEQVNYDGARSEYNIFQNGDGSITVDHPIWGTDTLNNIDALIFTGVEPGVGGAQSAPFEFISTDDLFA